jgi:hypothetical protein
MLFAKTPIDNESTSRYYPKSHNNPNPKEPPVTDLQFKTFTNPRGSAVFKVLSESDQAIARFLIKMFNLDENSAMDVASVVGLMERLNGPSI